MTFGSHFRETTPQWETCITTRLRDTPLHRAVSPSEAGRLFTLHYVLRNLARKAGNRRTWDGAEGSTVISTAASARYRASNSRPSGSIGVFDFAWRGVLRSAGDQPEMSRCRMPIAPAAVRPTAMTTSATSGETRKPAAGS